ncbi:MAG: FkbM family methyltransferase [Candidatus Nezhaarchaeales archaeon]
MLKKRIKKWFKWREKKLRTLIETLKYTKSNRPFYSIAAISDFFIDILLSFIISTRVKSALGKIIDNYYRWLQRSSRRAVVRIPDLNYDMTFLVMDYEALKIVLPEFERPIAKYFDYVSRKYGKGVFIDVGAHVGKYAVKMAKYGWNVIALEPHPINYKLLNFNAKVNKCNIKALQVAAYSSRGVLRLYLSDFSGRHSLVPRGNSYTFVLAEPIDDIVNSLGIPPHSIKFVKIDAEGVVVEVLKGMLNVLRYSKPDIIIEIDPNEKEALKFLKELGYKVVPIYELGTLTNYYYCFQ